MKETPKPDVIIIDPPRSGMHPDVVKAVAKIQPRKIVYVSCNPTTQARDIKMLFEYTPNYEIEVIQPIDMFPHTYHIENIAVINFFVFTCGYLCFSCIDVIDDCGYLRES